MSGSEVVRGEEIMKSFGKIHSDKKKDHGTWEFSESHISALEDSMRGKVVVSASRWAEYEGLACKGLLYNQLIKDYHLLRGKQVEVQEHIKKFPKWKLGKQDDWKESQLIGDRGYYIQTQNWFSELVRLLEAE